MKDSMPSDSLLNGRINVSRQVLTMFTLEQPADQSQYSTYLTYSDSGQRMVDVQYAILSKTLYK